MQAEQAVARGGALCMVVVVVLALPYPLAGQRSATAELLSLSVAVQDADYRGELERLRTLYSDLDALLVEPALARDVRYWRGFALWRRALNAANADLSVEDILADLDASIAEFEHALRADSAYVEAKIGAAAGLMNAAFFRRDDRATSSLLMARALRVLAEAERADPDNPRLAFVAAARRYWAPAEAGGDRREAIREVERVLQRASLESDRASLEPTWGVPELHMQLAFFHLNLTPAEPVAALRHAQLALDARPHWHYVRNILMPKIEAALLSSGSSGAARTRSGASSSGLFFEVSGSGASIVFIHAVSAGHRMWQAQVDAFGTHGRSLRSARPRPIDGSHQVRTWGSTTACASRRPWHRAGDARRALCRLGARRDLDADAIPV